MADIVLQTNSDGRYCSDLIDGRFQIMESVIYNGKYYVYDLVHDEIAIRNRDESITIFDTIDEAMNRIKGVKAVKANSDKATKPVKTTTKRQSGRAESALSFMKSILSSNPELDDTTISKMIKEKYVDSNYGPPMVKFNRKKMYG